MNRRISKVVVTGEGPEISIVRQGHETRLLGDILSDLGVDPERADEIKRHALDAVRTGERRAFLGEFGGENRE